MNRLRCHASTRWLIIAATAVSVTHAVPAAADSREADAAVLVTAERDKDLTEPTEQTVKLTRMPGTFGDPLEAIFSLPGIVPSGQDGGAPSVRGSGPGENVYLIDNLPAGFIFHDFGDSIFNEELIRDFGVSAAGYPARFGGANGAVFDTTLREPRVQPLRTTLDASLLRAGATFESGLGDNQAFYASYRESLIGLIVRAEKDRIKRESDSEFTAYPRASDLTAKYSWTLGAHDRLSILALAARDTAALDVGSRSDDVLIDPAAAGEASVDTSFKSLGAHWRHNDGPTTMEGGLGVLRTERHDKSGGGAEFANVDVTRWTAKARVDRRLNPENRLGAGVEASHSDIDYEIDLRYRPCSFFSPECRTEHGDWIYLKSQQPLDTRAVFVEHVWQPVKRLSVTTGLRYSDNRYLEETDLEPRLSAQLALSPAWLVHGAFGEYHEMPAVVQYVPVLGNPQLESPSARHYVLGVRERLSAGWSW
ncbi:MAG TPA: TonB-dependent receptor, partial [Vicinamibacterales bacterium]|nr:TonB-dependent receptor [Vicinamibacterales bacterium]